MGKTIESKKEIIEELISNDETEKAIDHLKKLYPYSFVSTHLKARFNALKFRRIIGIITEERYSVEKNKINHFILQFHKKGSKNDIQFYLIQKWSILLLWIFSILFAIFLYSFHKKGINVLLNIKTTKITFKATEDIFFDISEDLDRVRFERFSNINIPAHNIKLDKVNNGKLITIPDGLFKLTPIKGRKSNIEIDSLQLADISIPPNSDVQMQVFKEDNENLSTIKLYTKNVKTTLSYIDSLRFSFSNLNTDINKIQKKISSKGIAIKEQLDGSLIKINGQNKNGVSIIFPDLNKQIPFNLDHEINLSKLDFKDKARHNTKVVSSIVSSKIHFQDNDNETFQTIDDIQEGDFLELKPNNLFLRKININKEDIDIQLQGNVELLYTGKRNNDLNSRNPSILNWVYNCHFSWILIFIFLLIAISSFILLSGRLYLI